MPRITLRKHARLLIGSSLAIVLLAGGVAFAVGTIPGSDGVIHGCYNNRTGALRVIDPASTSCADKESPIFWNQEGAPGDDGTDGTNGIPVSQTCPEGDYVSGIAADGSLTCTSLPGGGTSDPDTDGDGYPASTDCNDTDAAINPGATEVDNGQDDDCDGIADEGSSDPDLDGDGFRASTDCNDSNAAVNPGATEVDNGIDDDCDSLVDEDSANTDADGDGFRASSDCNDSDAAIYPGAPEVANGQDDDCDGQLGSQSTGSDTGECQSGTQYEQSDGSWSAPQGEIGPSAEIEDGLDNDCDGVVDDTN